MKAKETGESGSSFEILYLLACAARYELIVVLSAGPANVSTLTAKVGREMPHVSVSLKVLEDAGLVTCTHVKATRVYQLSEQVMVTRADDEVRIRIRDASGSEIAITHKLGPTPVTGAPS